MFIQCTQTSRESKLDFYNLSFIRRESKELCRFTNLPTISFELLPFLGLHLPAA